MLIKWKPNKIILKSSWHCKGLNNKLINNSSNRKRLLMLNRFMKTQCNNYIIRNKNKSITLRNNIRLKWVNWSKTRKNNRRNWNKDTTIGLWTIKIDKPINYSYYNRSSNNRRYSCNNWINTSNMLDWERRTKCW